MPFDRVAPNTRRGRSARLMPSARPISIRRPAQDEPHAQRRARSPDHGTKSGSAVERISWRRIQLLLRSTDRRVIRSTSRHNSADSSSCMATWSSKLHWAPGSKDTSRSMSLSARKSARKADPKSHSALIRQRAQRAASPSTSIGMFRGTPTTTSYFLTAPGPQVDAYPPPRSRNRHQPSEA